jgi:hypothetical protein
MTAAEIAEVLGMALSTVSAVLLRIGLGKRSRLEPSEPPNRYERKRPGGLIHIDVKKLGRIEKVGHRIHNNRASSNARSHWHKGYRARTARPSASSARCSAAGHTARSTAPPPSAPAPSQAGSTTTIADDHTAASTASHPSPASRS